jgi:DNA-binding MarR family transcriptional regulator
MKGRTISDVTRLRMQVMSFTRRLRREASDDAQSWAQLSLLGAIDRHGRHATPSGLAAAEGMRSSNLAAALRELDARGLISRTPDIEDRRKTRVALTDAGRRLLHDNRARRERWLSGAIQACLTAEERDMLFAAGTLLERITAHAGADPEPIDAHDGKDAP